MQCQIHQDVDSIFPDQIGGLRIRQPHDVAPFIRLPPELLRERILSNRVGITDYLELPAIALPNQRQQIASDRVFAEIR